MKVSNWKKKIQMFLLYTFNRFIHLLECVLFFFFILLFDKWWNFSLNACLNALSVPVAFWMMSDTMNDEKKSKKKKSMNNTKQMTNGLRLLISYMDNRLMIASLQNRNEEKLLNLVDIYSVYVFRMFLFFIFIRFSLGRFVFRRTHGLLITWLKRTRIWSRRRCFRWHELLLIFFFFFSFNVTMI